MSLVVDTHRQYLEDDARVSAFRRALAEVLRPGDTVLDLGSGTGILGLLACEAGAGRVYSMEETGLSELARAVAAANGVADRIVFVQGWSREARLPERVDVIVCDFIGGFGFDATLVGDGSNARDRFLKPGGTMIPRFVEIEVAPVEDADAYSRIEFWTRRPYGFDFAPARRWAANTGYPLFTSTEASLGSPATIACIDMMTIEGTPVSLAHRFVATRSGTLHGLGAWFRARLSPTVVLSNAPDAQPRMNRRNVFFPIDTPAAVDAGDLIDVRMQVIPTETVVAWSVDIRSPGTSTVKGRFRQSTLNGMLLSRDELRRTNPTFVPQRTPRGNARLDVLTLCDGQRPLAEIEREMLRLHPDLFRSLGEAGAFVAEVVTRYSV
jgi:SAM-dependent methyltransferase